MSRRSYRRHTLEFKVSVLRRMAEAPNITELARELDIERRLLYEWRDIYATSGEAGLRSIGRPSREALAALASLEPPRSSGACPAETSARIAELERKIGEQAVALDFFRTALRHVRERRRRNGGPGETNSTP